MTPAAKWPSPAPPPPSVGLSFCPRGLLLYVPLVVSLGLNSLWFSSLSPGRVEAPAASLHTEQESSGETAPRLLGSEPPCGGALLRDTWRHLSDVVLIVSFKDDSTAQDAAQFVRELYGRFFLTVVTCAPTENETLGIESRGARSWGKNPAYQYYFFPKMAARYRNAAGFLFAAADVAINYWTLVEGDKHKLWLPFVPQKQKLVPFVATGTDEGNSDASLFPEEATVMRKAVKSALGRLEPEFIDTFKRSIQPQTNAYPIGAANIFYVPQRLALSFAFDLIPPFRDFAVFQDAAVPSMFYALEDPSSYDPVLHKLAYSVDSAMSGDAHEWMRDKAGVFPWSLGSAEDRGRLIGVLAQVDSCLKGLIQDAAGQS